MRMRATLYVKRRLLFRPGREQSRRQGKKTTNTMTLLLFPISDDVCLGVAEPRSQLWASLWSGRGAPSRPPKGGWIKGARWCGGHGHLFAREGGRSGETVLEVCEPGALDTPSERAHAELLQRLLRDELGPLLEAAQKAASAPKGPTSGLVRTRATVLDALEAVRRSPLFGPELRAAMDRRDVDAQSRVFRNAWDMAEAYAALPKILVLRCPQPAIEGWGEERGVW